MPGEIFPDTGTLHVAQALQKFHERNGGATWLEAGVVETAPDGNWVLEDDGRARFDDIYPPQTPYGANPTEFVSHPGTDLNAQLSPAARATFERHGFLCGPEIDYNFGYGREPSYAPSDEEMRAVHAAKLTAEGYTFSA